MDAGMKALRRTMSEPVETAACTREADPLVENDKSRGLTWSHSAQEKNLLPEECYSSNNKSYSSASLEERKDVDRKPTFDDLFFDLLFGAALSVYSQTAELSSVAKVAGFSGYFALLWWAWVTQVLNDVRFRRHDKQAPLWLSTAQRILNLVLLGTWVAFGTVSSEFARQGFTNFTKIYALTRAILILNALLILLENWTRRESASQKASQSILWINILAQSISLILWICSPLTTDDYGIKGSLLAMWIVSIAVELIAQVCTECLGRLQDLSKTRIAERMALFSLIVFGTGFEGIGTALNTISPGGRNWDLGGVPQGGWGSLTILNAVCAVAIVFLLFFGYYRKAVTRLSLSPTITISWCYAHVFLHLASAVLVVGLNKLISLNNTYSAVLRFQSNPSDYLPTSSDWQDYIQTRFEAFLTQSDIPDVWSIQDTYDRSVASILLAILSTQGALIPSIEQATTLIDSTRNWNSSTFPPALQVALQPYYNVVTTVQASDAFAQWTTKNLFQFYYVYICAGIYLLADVALKAMQHLDLVRKRDATLLISTLFAVLLILVQAAYITTTGQDPTSGPILGGLSILVSILVAEIFLQIILPTLISYIRGQPCKERKHELTDKE